MSPNAPQCAPMSPCVPMCAPCAPVHAPQCMRPSACAPVSPSSEPRLCDWPSDVVLPVACAGVAAQLALRLQRAHTPAWGLVLEAPFFSLRSAALTFPAALPLLALPGARALVLRCFMDGLRTGEALRQLPALPLLILHGDEDVTVPIQHTQALVARMQSTCMRGRSAPCRVEVLRGCDHLQAILDVRTYTAISVFLREARGGPRRDARGPPPQRSPTHSRTFARGGAPEQAIAGVRLKEK